MDLPAGQAGIAEVKGTPVLGVFGGKDHMAQAGVTGAQVETMPMLAGEIARAAMAGGA